MLILTRLHRLEQRLRCPDVALGIISLGAGGICSGVLIYHLPFDCLLKTGMQEFMNAAYRLWSNVFAPPLADRRYDSLGLQELLIIALYYTGSDFLHFQRSYERADIIVYIP